MTDSASVATAIDPHIEGPSVAPLRPWTALVGFVLIYGLTILSCAIINIWAQHFPIGAWSNAGVSKNFWLDHVSWQIFAAGSA